MLVRASAKQRLVRLLWKWRRECVRQSQLHASAALCTQQAQSIAIKAALRVWLHNLHERRAARQCVARSEAFAHACACKKLRQAFFAWQHTPGAISILTTVSKAVRSHVQRYFANTRTSGTLQEDSNTSDIKPSNKFVPLCSAAQHPTRFRRRVLRWCSDSTRHAHHPAPTLASSRTAHCTRSTTAVRS